MQPLGHLQPCPLYCDRCDQTQHDAQAAEHREHHGVDGLVEGALLSQAENEEGPRGVHGTALSPSPSLGLPAPPG